MPHRRPAAGAVRSRCLIPSSSEFPRVGEGTMAAINNGNLLLLYDARRQPGDHDRAIIRSHFSADEGLTWRPSTTVLEDPAASLMQPSLTRRADGALGLTYSRLLDHQTASKHFTWSTDEGKTWNKAVQVSHGECAYMTGAHDRLLTLKSGRLLALLHGKVLIGPGEFDCEVRTYVSVSDDGGLTWITTTPEGLQSPDNPSKRNQGGLWECSAVEYADGQLLLMGRTATGWAWQSWSADNGSTWTPAAPSAVPNPLAPVRLTRVPGQDTLLLIRNPEVDLTSGWHGGARLRLTVRSSTDHGQSWGPDQVLEPAQGPEQWFDYPFLLWRGDTLHLGYRAPTPATFHCAIHYQRRRWDGYSLLPLA
jgi:hypothetical protein